MLRVLFGVMSCELQSGTRFWWRISRGWTVAASREAQRLKKVLVFLHGRNWSAVFLERLVSSPALAA